MTGKGTVAVSLVGCSVLVGGGKLLHAELPSYRQIEGLFFLFIILAIGSELAPEVAGSLALLILVTVFLETGAGFFTGLNNLIASTTTASAKVQSTPVGSSNSPTRKLA